MPSSCIHCAGSLPVWTFALGGALLEKRLWMACGANTTYISYRVVRASGPVALEITPLVTYRDFHALTMGAGWQPHSEALPGGVLIRAFDTAQPLRLLADGGTFTTGSTWYWNFFHREEAARGLGAHADLYAPGTFAVTLAPDAIWTLALTSEIELLPATTAHAARGHRAGLGRRGAPARVANTHRIGYAASSFIMHAIHVATCFKIRITECLYKN